MNNKEQMLKVRLFHDADAQTYYKSRYHSDTCEGLAYVTRKQLIDELIDANPGRILDIGCGPGLFTQELIDRGYTVFSTDISFEMLRVARASLEGNGYLQGYFALSDASRLPFKEGSFDTIMCIGVLCYVSEYVSSLKEIVRCLKPNGTAIIQINKIVWPSLYKIALPIYRKTKKAVTGKSYEGMEFEFNMFSHKKFIADCRMMNMDITKIIHYDFRIPFVDILFPDTSVRLGKIIYKYRRCRVVNAISNALLIEMRNRNISCA